jgi:hypothetical protein
MSNAERAEKSRRTAQALLEQRQKRDDDVKRQIAKERQALDAKVAKLRELRLAKEAADAALPPPPPSPRKPRSPRAPG